MIGIVEWDETDLDQLWDRFQWTDVPSTMDVVLAQEDLWVYEALLRVIKSVNATATNQTNASVKRINALEIGKRLAGCLEELAGDRVSPGPQPARAECRQVSRRRPDTRQACRGRWPGGLVDRQSERDLFVDRYVDEKGQPLPLKDDYPYVKHRRLSIR